MANKVTVANNQKDLNLDYGRFTHNIRNEISFDNNSHYDYVSILSGMYIIESTFEITPNEDDYLDHAYNCMRKLKSLHVDLYGFTGTTDEKGELCLPTGARAIEYVTNGSEDWSTWSNWSQLSQRYAPGTYITFNFLGDKIVTNYPNQDLSVAYWREKTGDDKQLLVTEQEAEACAYWWIWVDARRRAYKGTGGNYLQQAMFDKNKAFNQAKIPNQLTQNMINQLGNVYTSQDRKFYNRSYKPVKLG